MEQAAALSNALQWLGGGFFVLLSLIGVGKIVEMLISRFFKNRDGHAEMHDTNRGKEIDSADKDKDRLNSRVEKLEEDIDKLRETQLAMAVDNAELKVENESLRKENVKQEGEIKELQSTVHRLEVEVAGSTAVYTELERTKAALAQCESREPLGIETANSLRADIESIVENVTNLSFMPTSDNPAPDDETAIRRLKEMRAAAKRMKGAINGNA